MDLMVESGNRLWGCKYGVTDKGFLNEIYCCALGDFRNWYRFRGVSTDSYVVSVGADGPFTGAVSYLGRPIFFKENCMIEVYGSYPENYQLQTTPCDGVQTGCHKSLAVVNNVLYYKSTQGVCAYDGSMPVQKGRVFGSVFYENAVAGAWGSKYCISMQHPYGWGLFLYDTQKDLWHREDATQVRAFAFAKGYMYGLVGERTIVNMSDDQPGETVSWMVQTGPMGLTDAGRQYVSRLSVRLWAAEGATVSVSCQYDDRQVWETLYTLTGSELHSVTIPIRPRRCDHMRLKLEGTGEVRIYSMTKTWEEGSDCT